MSGQFGVGTTNGSSATYFSSPRAEDRKGRGAPRATAYGIMVAAFVLAASITSPASAQNPATLKTDKPNHQPGETVVFTGQNWAPGEDVIITLSQGMDVLVERAFPAVADNDGNVVNTDLVLEEADLARTLVAVAVGNSSGSTASVRVNDDTLQAEVAAPPVVGGDGDVKFIQPNRPIGVAFPPMYVPDEFVIELKPEARRQIVVVRPTGPPQVNLADLQQSITGANVVHFQRQFENATPPAAGDRHPDLTGYHKVKLAPGANLQAAMTAFANNPRVDHVEPIGIHPIDAEPNDPYYDFPTPSCTPGGTCTFNFDQWHYFDRNTSFNPNENFSIQANQAWDFETGAPSVIIAVTDTGVRYYHRNLGGDNAAWTPSSPPASPGNIFVNPGEIPNNGVDDDANGLVDDTVGYDFVSTFTCGTGCTGCCDTDCSAVDNDPRDHNGHGTHVAGTIAAITNNNRLVAGIAGGFSDGATTGAGNGVKILPLRVGYSCTCSGTCGYGFVRMDFVAAAFNYVATMRDKGFNIAAINCSFGTSDSGGLGAALAAVKARNVLVVHAAGNDNNSTQDFFATQAGVLDVGATDRTGTPASFTSFGTSGNPWVEVAAPGVAILSTWHEFTDTGPDYIAVLDGTSMSTPHVVGIAGLLKSCNPSLSATQIFNLIKDNTRPVQNPGSKVIGGIANAFMALSAAGCTTKGNLEGTVRDAVTSNPIGGATVSTSVPSSNSTTTSGSGFYQFLDITTGSYSVTASATGYASSTATGVVVNDSQTTTRDFLLSLNTNGCLTDTTQADFQAGVATNVDLNASPGDAVLTHTGGPNVVDQQNQNLSTSGYGFTNTSWAAQTFTPSVSGTLTPGVWPFCSVPAVVPVAAVVPNRQPVAE